MRVLYLPRVFYASPISAFRFNSSSNIYFVEGKIEGRIEVKGKRRIRRKQLLDGHKKMKRYWKLEEEAPDRTPIYSDLTFFTWSKI
jgi:hypothetical protein